MMIMKKRTLNKLNNFSYDKQTSRLIKKLYHNNPNDMLLKTLHRSIIIYELIHERQIKINDIINEKGSDD
jgi:hypothetical protein